MTKLMSRNRLIALLLNLLAIGLMVLAYFAISNPSAFRFAVLSPNVVALSLAAAGILLGTLALRVRTRSIGTAGLTSPASERQAKGVRVACLIMGIGFAAITCFGFASIFWTRDVGAALSAGLAGALVGGAFGGGVGYLMARTLVSMYKPPDKRQ
jgi:hypothetical protein